MNDELRDEAQDLWREIGKPELAYPTSEQLLAFMRRCSDALGTEYAARMITASEAQHQCWIANHDGLLEELRLTRLALSKADRVVDAVREWLGPEAADAIEAGA